MSKKTEIELTFAIPFDHTLYIDPSLIGYQSEIKIDGMVARFELPGEKEEGSLALTPPQSAIEGSTKHLPDGWGRFDDKFEHAEIEACLIIVPTLAEIEHELSEGQIGGEDIHKLINKATDWFDSFVHWIWALTSQSLDPSNPDPKVIHRKSNNPVTIARSLEDSSHPTIKPRTFSMIMNKDGPVSEKIVNEDVIDAAVTSAGSIPPFPLELLASARMNARRGNLRRSMTDAGTAVELSLTKALGLDEYHRLTLGSLTKEAEKHGITMPLDMQSAFVDVRNDAVHRGKLSDGKSLNRAIEIAEELIALTVPELIPFSDLEYFFRPYRFDMIWIKPSE